MIKEKICKTNWFAKKICWSPRCAAHRRDHFVIEYLGKIETELENILACLSGAQMDLNYEKLEVENLVTHSL